MILKSEDNEFNDAFFELKKNLLRAKKNGPLILVSLRKFFLCNYSPSAAYQISEIESAVYPKKIMMEVICSEKDICKDYGEKCKRCYLNLSSVVHEELNDESKG